MKKRIINNIIKVVAFCVVLALVFRVLDSFLTYIDPANTASVNGLRSEEEDSLDVVLVGASEVYADYSAVLAYEKYGYTSYSFALTGVPGSIYKSMVREVLTEQSPKVLVIEINGFVQNDKYFDRVLQLKGWINNIDNKERRELAIQEAVSEKNLELFTGNSFVTNHSNWKIPSDCATSYYAKVRGFFQKSSELKGFSNHATISHDKLVDKPKKIYFTEKGKAYYEDFLDFCDGLDVEHIVLARFPHEREAKNPEVFDEMQKMAEAHGFTFLNCENIKDEIGIQKTYDYYNREHLNIFGAQKFTDYLSSYLVENYNLANQTHSEEVAAQWEKSITAFHEYEEKLEKNTKNDAGGIYFEYWR